VVKTIHVDVSDSHQRRAVIVQVEARGNEPPARSRRGRAFAAEVIELNPTSVTIGLFAPPQRVDEPLAVLPDHQVLDLADTGVLTMRGGRRRAAQRPAGIPVRLTRSAPSRARSTG